MSNGPITAREKNFRSEDDYYKMLFNDLDFWCDGDMKVFLNRLQKMHVILSKGHSGRANKFTWLWGIERVFG